MTRSLRLVFASALTVGLLVTGAAAASPTPGYVDFGQLAPAAGRQFVQVDLDGSLLRLAATFADKKDPEIAKLIGGLKRVRVNVVGLDDNNRASTRERMDEFRRTLDGAGWKRVVTVTEGSDGDDVAVFLQQDADDVIQGLVVTVMSRGGEAVFVNVVGEVAPDQIAALGERINVKPLTRVKVATTETR